MLCCVCVCMFINNPNIHYTNLSFLIQARAWQREWSRVNRRIIAISPAGCYAARDAQPVRARRDAMRARLPFFSYLRSLVWSTTTPSRGPIYFTESLPLLPLSFLSRRATHARQSVLPAEFTRRPEATIRSRVFVSPLDACPTPRTVLLSKPSHSGAVFFVVVKGE